ncbi:MAG: HAMP domain-containing histidine kinase [Firmicutes bacterium]|nr:HAMP domain-containing histidine kinase [Bacillota bacterium]
MATKSKKNESNVSSGLGLLDGFCWVLAVVSGTACGILASLALCLGNMVDLEAYKESIEDTDWMETNPWFVNIPDTNAFSDMVARLLTWAVIAGVILVVSVIVLSVLTGRFSRNADGSIHLNWFDRFWSEVQLAGVFGFGTAACALCIPLIDIARVHAWTDVFTPNITDDHWFGPSNSFIVKLCIAGMAASILLTVLFFLPLVKKLKAHQFWEKSLLGGIWLWIYRGLKHFFDGLIRAFRENRSTMTKVMVVLIGGAVLSATWIGFPVVIVLIVVFAPRLVRKFTAVQTGAAQVRNGNLNWKIPVESDSHGVRGELDRLAADINAISDATEIAVKNELKNQRLKTELISNVSHDLKTPLTSMTAYVDLLKQEGLDSPNAPEYLEILDSKTQRLKVLTENLFEAAKASSGAMPVVLSEIDLPALVTQSLAEMEERLAVRSLKIIVRNQCETGDCKVIADGQLLWRVIENLLGNVSKYALPSSRVYINISRINAAGAGLSGRPERIMLEVKNISEDPLNISADELMERFKRGDESRNTEGSGLGLAIARDLVHLMKGTFEITIDGDLFKACVVLDEAGTAGAAGFQEQEEDEPDTQDTGEPNRGTAGDPIPSENRKPFFRRMTERFAGAVRAAAAGVSRAFQSLFRKLHRGKKEETVSS